MPLVENEDGVGGNVGRNRSRAALNDESLLCFVLLETNKTVLLAKVLNDDALTVALVNDRELPEPLEKQEHMHIELL